MVANADVEDPKDVEVCLVHMPYSDLEWPTIGLGLLKSYLTEHGISSRVVYGNLHFASLIGLTAYKDVMRSAPEVLAGEWTFASAAFRGEAPADAPYLAWLAKEVPHYWQSRSLEVVGETPYQENGDGLRWFTEVRDAAPAFVEETARRILDLNPRIVGCTSVFQQHCASLALLRRIKELAPATVTMMGGANCEGVMGETTHRHFPWVDFVMSGEVDAFFGGFCKRVLEEGPEAASLDAPHGVFGPRERSGGYGAVAPRAVLHSMDDAAIPDFDDYFDEIRAAGLDETVYPGLVFESSRGCWWGQKHHCTFCGLNDEGLVFRSKSPGRVVDEIMALKEKYGIGWLVSTDAIIDVKHLRTVLPALAVRSGSPYLFYEVKANLKRTDVKLLSLAGVRTIQPGIEGLHDEFLKLIDKGNRWYTNIQLLKWSQESGINVNWNFLSAAPGEREEWYYEVAEWLPLVYHLEPPGPDAAIPLRYDRYSVYHSKAEEYGLELVAKESYGHVYPLRPEVLDDLAYVFEDKRERENRPPTDSGGYQALNRSIAEWQLVFRGNNGNGGRPARLTAREVDGQLVLRDTRPIRTSETFTFDGLERAVLEACETAQSPRSLGKQLRSGGHSDSDEQIDACVEQLKDLHLLLDWRGRILSLHVNEPVTRYLTPSERPGIRTVRKKEGVRVWG